jgi:hypothetical protein
MHTPIKKNGMSVLFKTLKYNDIIALITKAAYMEYSPFRV